MRRRLIFFVAIAALMLPVIAHAESFQIDKAHTTVGFGVKHFGVSTVSGVFDDFDATLDWDGKDLATAKTTVTIQVGSINTRNGKRDDHLRNPDFFEVAKYPTITFVSKKVESTGPNTAVVTGDLTIKGVTREVKMDVTHNGTIDDPMGNVRAGFSASVTVNRKDFGVVPPGVTDKAIGDDVNIHIETEFTRPK